MTRTCRHVFVRGRVQGVAFRWSAAEQARRLDVAGWVRNLADGRVEGWLEGAAEDVEAMLAWLRRGPPAARVETVDVHERPPEDHTSFTILPTARG